MASRKLLVSADYGTKTLSLAYRIVKPGEKATESNVRGFDFSPSDDYAPQKAAWAENGDFYWGHNLNEALEAGVVDPDSVIELWKLLLYKSHQTSAIANTVREQLGDHGIEELLETHLRAVLTKALTDIQSIEWLHFTAEDIHNMPLQLFLSVPQMWEAPANRMMIEAAKRAGAEYVELVYEPQCAAAYYTHDIKDKLPARLNIGDILLIADIGGGTGDFVSYEYCESSDSGATVELKTTGSAKGRLCGSEFVNRHFLAWLRKHPEFEAKCNELGITAKSCLRLASEAFEPIKKSFPGWLLHPVWMIVRAGGAPFWQIELTSKDIESFFEPVFLDIAEGIGEQVTAKTKALIISGGFGRSKYLINALQTTWGHLLHIFGQSKPIAGAFQPVSRGALLRYNAIKARGMPSADSFAIGTVEIYSPAAHPDATYQPGDVLGGKKGMICRNRHKRRDLVKKCPYDGAFVVYDRWLPILQKGTPRDPGQPFTTETWQRCLFPVDNKTLEVQIYWTSSRIEAGEPIFVGADPDTRVIRKDIECWGGPLCVELPDLKALGFKSFQSGKFWAYNILLRFVLSVDGANVEVKWEIGKPGLEQYDDEDSLMGTKAVLANHGVFKLCEGTFNPFPRTEV